MGFLDGFLGKIAIDENSQEDIDDIEEDDVDESEDIDDDEDIDTDDEDEKSVPEETSKPSALTKKSRFKGFSSSSNNNTANSGKVVPMSTNTTPITKQSEVCMILPKGYDNSTEIAEILLSGKTVVLNMEGMNIDAAQRIIDFTSGACFTMGGTIQKISKKIFIATPSNVELTGDFSNLFGDGTNSTDLNISV